MNPTTTTYVSFAPNGGRIGRIAWSNGDEDNWGHIYWDHHWPVSPIQSIWEKVLATFARVGQQMSDAFARAANTFLSQNPNA